MQVGVIVLRYLPTLLNVDVDVLSLRLKPQAIKIYWGLVGQGLFS